jgi:hypothetical protein
MRDAYPAGQMPSSRESATDDCEADGARGRVIAVPVYTGVRPTCLRVATVASFGGRPSTPSLSALAGTMGLTPLYWDRALFRDLLDELYGGCIGGDVDGFAARWLADGFALREHGVTHDLAFVKLFVGDQDCTRKLYDCRILAVTDFLAGPDFFVARCAATTTRRAPCVGSAERAASSSTTTSSPRTPCNAAAKRSPCAPGSTRRRASCASSTRSHGHSKPTRSSGGRLGAWRDVDACLKLSSLRGRRPGWAATGASELHLGRTDLSLRSVW